MMKEYIEVTDKKSPVKSQEIDTQKRIQAVKVLDDLWHEPRYYGVFEDANNYYSTIKAFDAPLKACNEARKQKKNVDQSIKTSKPKKRFIKKTDTLGKTRTKVTKKKFELLTDFEVRQSNTFRFYDKIWVLILATNSNEKEPVFVKDFLEKNKVFTTTNIKEQAHQFATFERAKDCKQILEIVTTNKYNLKPMYRRDLG